ncbi:MAG: FAD:protein FMN transferase [Candidatus Polarisedimenticolaceae bacterium]|nr:FAD:protein FMN transferase [Candidatus Polarisedimenticolaceae bacterium]
MADLHIEQQADYWLARFTAMASPCELLMEVANRTEAEALAQCAYDEAKRIERTFSRYRDDNIIHQINTSSGCPIEVDEEMANLLDYADHCYQLSEGRFDITSGLLRQAWKFDGSDNLPETALIERLRLSVSWKKVIWQRPFITLPKGMEIDLGGIGKEYAVDSTTNLLRQKTAASLLINFGGDLAVTHARKSGNGWCVAIDHPDRCGSSSGQEIEIKQGALATSGDAQRYLLKDGIRYSHILDPTTGWPVAETPRSVTVHAANCTEAGILATLSMLHGRGAEAFLKQQQVTSWVLR